MFTFLMQYILIYLFLFTRISPVFRFAVTKTYQMNRRKTHIKELRHQVAILEIALFHTTIIMLFLFLFFLLLLLLFTLYFCLNYIISGESTAEIKGPVFLSLPSLCLSSASLPPPAAHFLHNCCILSSTWRRRDSH